MYILRQRCQLARFVSVSVLNKKKIRNFPSSFNSCLVLWLFFNCNFFSFWFLLVVCVCRGSIFENEEWQRRVLFSFGALSLYFDVDRSYFHHYGPNDDPTDPKMVVLLIVIDDISLPPHFCFIISLFHYFIISNSVLSPPHRVFRFRWCLHFVFPFSNYYRVFKETKKQQQQQQ